MIAHKSPLLITSIFFICGIPIPILAWSFWFRRTRIFFEKEAVQVENDYLLFRLRKTIPRESLRDIFPQISMEICDHPYYDICLKITDGSTIHAGRMVRSKREAEWLAAEMKRMVRL